MRHILIKSLVLLLLYSCGEKEHRTTVNEGLSFEELEKIEKENEPIIDKLKALEPITTKEIDEWMPKSLNGLERTSYVPDAVPQSFIFITKTTFNDPNSNKKLELMFMDGAGQMGSVTLSPFLKLDQIYSESSNEEGYQKIVAKNDEVYFQKYSKNGDKFILQFAPQNRYVFKIETENLTEVELWSAVAQLHYENLPGI